MRELSRGPFSWLEVVFDDETGRELTLRGIVVPGLAERYALTQKLREHVARAGQTAHPCLPTPVACGADRPTESVWVTYDVALRSESAEGRAYDALGAADKLATLSEIADALVVAGASGSVHGTLHPGILHVDRDAPRGVYVPDLDLGPYLREAATSVAGPAPYVAFAAPEIRRSPLATGTRAADVYSVAALARAVISHTRIDAPAALAALLPRALADEPDTRPAMRELAHALRDVAESLAGRGGTADRALRDAKRDATVRVEGPLMEAARRSHAPEPPPRRRRRERFEGVAMGVAALVLASVLAFLARPSNVGDGRLRVSTTPVEADGGVPSTVRLFVDGRFRGVVSPDEQREVSLAEGAHHIEMRFEDGGVAARRRVEVNGLTAVTVRVPAVKTDDFPTILRRARVDRFGERCTGTWAGTLDPGRRRVVVTLARAIEDGVCGHVDAGALGAGALRACDFDGESLLIGEVTLRGPRTLALRFVCGASPELTFFAPTGRASLTRVDEPAAAITDAGTP